MTRPTFEEQCSAALAQWQASNGEDKRFSSPGYAEDPRALLAFLAINDNSLDSAAGRLWPEADINESTAGTQATFSDFKRDGLYSHRAKWACDLFTVHGTGTDPTTGLEVLVINTIDAQRRVRQLRIPRGIIVGNEAQFASYCAERGFNISLERPERTVVRALLARLRGPTLTLTDRSGWTKDNATFVLPSGKTIGETNKRIVFTADKAEAANTITANGDYAEWKATISKAVSGNSRLELALCAGLYSPLMPYTGDPRCVIFNIHGESSLGKTTSGHIFGSVWGGHPTRGLRFAQPWNQTYNSLNALAASYSGIGLSLDEIQHCSNPDIAYSFSDGEEKGRLDSNSKQKSRRTWQCIAWSTGEKRMDDLVSENIRTKDSGVQSGREARFFDIPVSSTGSIKGVVESLNGFSDPAQLIAEISDLTRHNYGHAGPEFVEAIQSFVNEHGEDALKAKVGKLSGQLLERLGLDPDANPLVKRVARQFAQVGVAGVVAAEFGVIDNDPADLANGVVKCFADWVAQRGSQQFTKAEIAPLTALRDYIQSRRHLFGGTERPDEVKGQEIVGYSKVISGKPCFLMTNKSWEAAQRQGRASDLAKSLEQRGLLVTDKDGRRKQQVWIKGPNNTSTKERFYAVSAQILNIDDAGNVAADLTGDVEMEDGFATPTRQERVPKINLKEITKSTRAGVH